MSPWERMKEIAEQANAARIMSERTGNQYCAMSHDWISQMASELADLYERLGLRQESQELTERLIQGQEYLVTLRLRVRVADVSSSHGLCYQLDLETRDFMGQRCLSLDANEIVGAELAERPGGPYG